MDFTLDRVVREFMVDDLGLDAIDRRYARFLSLAISGLRDLYYDNVGGVIREVVLDVNDDDTVSLPSDYIEYQAIGMVSNGQFLSFGLNQNYADVYTDDCGDRITPTDTESETGYTQFSSSYNDLGENLGREYGVGDGYSSIGDYKIYRDRGYIALSNISAEQIVLRYKADINMVDGDFLVHPYNVEAIKAWIWKKYVGKSRSHNLGQIQLAEKAYKDEKKKALRRHYSFNINEFIQSWKKGQRGSPRL